MKVYDFYKLIDPNLQYDVVLIQDIYGPTATDPLFEALVVSEETRKGAQQSMINLRFKYLL